MELLESAIERFGAKALAEALRVKTNQLSVWRSRKGLSKPRRALIEHMMSAPTDTATPIEATLQTEAIVAAIRESGAKIEKRLVALENRIEAMRLSFDRQRGERMRPRDRPGEVAPGS